mmetsp:Transcript_66157/g.109927  ORF Transcript_66157/g.109927 Transcript_66157/m.109927 type:complete len:106 (-) Transcript_66157:128-445(-)
MKRTGRTELIRHRGISALQGNPPQGNLRAACGAGIIMADDSVLLPRSMRKVTIGRKHQMERVINRPTYSALPSKNRKCYALACSLSISVFAHDLSCWFVTALTPN